MTAKPSSDSELDPVPVLMDLQKFFSSSRKWTQGAYARISKTGQICNMYGSKAACWCLVGGLKQLEQHYSFEQIDAAIKALAHVINPHNGTRRTLIIWNDATERRFADVKALIAKAIEESKEKTQELKA